MKKVAGAQDFSGVRPLGGRGGGGGAQVEVSG